MPSEHMQQSQSQTRPAIGNHRSTSSIHSQTDSPAASPPQYGKPKTQKHVVHGGRTHGHTRVPSGKALHKLSKAHGNGNGNGNEGSHTDLKKLGKNSSSSTNLKKNTSHANLKRNRSYADVPKRPKSSGEATKRPTSVHFEIGEEEDVVGKGMRDAEVEVEVEDAWEEASSSASPALSRAPSRNGHSTTTSSSKPSANNSRPQTPSTLVQSPTSHTNGPPPPRSSADAKVITERLLNRIPSHHTTTTKMSHTLATATPSSHSPPLSTPKTEPSSSADLNSRFVDSSTPTLTPATSTPPSFPQPSATTEPRRAQSMANLSRNSSTSSTSSTSALKPRSRKASSTKPKPKSTTTTYNPPQQSRTQQKMWLQRQSSIHEPITPVGYEGLDPRIKVQLERTGLEYLGVRRYRDPVGQAVKRLGQLPGLEKHQRIPMAPQSARGSPRKRIGNGNGNGDYGLSQSLKEGRGSRGKGGSYEGQEQSGVGAGSVDSVAGDTGDEGVGAVLRSLWEKNYDLSTSAD